MQKFFRAKKKNILIHILLYDELQVKQLAVTLLAAGFRTWTLLNGSERKEAENRETLWIREPASQRANVLWV